MPSGSQFADMLAAAVGGSVRELPDRERTDQLIVLADGRVPLLVRDFGHALGVCLVGVRSWHDRPANFDDALAQVIVADTQVWAAAEPLTLATMLECASVLTEFLTAHTRVPWTASIPGVGVPRELWLHPREGSASVGVFADAIRVWNRERSLERTVVVRADLQPTSSSMQAIAAAVDGQLDAHVSNRYLEVRIELAAKRLQAKLEPRLGACVVSRMGLTSYSGTIRLSLRFGRDEVRVFARDGRVIVEAGLVGAQGWSDSGEVVEEMIDPILSALEVERRSLTIDKLTVGCEYEVREDLQELRAGMIVRFDGFDDIDNHYGRYEFTSRDGRRVAVAGDFSTPRNSPLRDAHRYLKAIDP